MTISEQICLQYRDEVAELNARIAHLEQQAARLANLPGLPGWISGKWTIDGTYIYGEDA